MKSFPTRASMEAYRIAGQAALPLMRARYAQRVRDGLERADRLQEHFGRPSLARDEGCYVWFNAGSADEARSMLPLVRLCLSQNLNVVATSPCRYGLALWEQEAANNSSLAAQYTPVDVDRCVNRFLSHWQPELMITVADEVMPVAMACLQQRQISCVVVSGVIGRRAHDFWSVRPKLARETFGAIALVAAADQVNAEMFRDLGARNVEVCGDLSFDAPVRSDGRHIHRAFWAREGLAEETNLWLATPSNDKELALCLETQRALELAGANIVCALAPPPSMRMSDIETAVSSSGLNLSKPPLGDYKQAHHEGWAASANVLLFDFGEDGERAAIRSDAIYLGGAFGNGRSEGLSPVPAIQHRLAIASGERVQRHVGFFSQLHRANAVRLVSSGSDLAGFLSIVLADKDAHRRMTDAALRTLWSMQGATDSTYMALDRYLRPLIYKASIDSIPPSVHAAE
ncbi:MAG: glycosyltransferase N-terminal domain-containing protein [Pseudomonadota bacterium]